MLAWAGGAMLHACAAPPSSPVFLPSPPVRTRPRAPRKPDGGVDYRCNGDADCVVKDVGNCCGYYPACVNRASPTFPAQVEAECAKKGMASVCGFPVIRGCACVDGRCRDGSSGGTQIR